MKKSTRTMPRPWTLLEDDLLREAVERFGDHRIEWCQVADTIGGGRTNRECRKRYCYSIDRHIKKGAWSRKEDDALLEGHRRWGTWWVKVAQEHVPFRTGDQCAKRFTGVLDPSINKSEWTKQEDEQLMRLSEQEGRSWGRICQSFNGRPAIQCRNRWMRLKALEARAREAPDSTATLQQFANATAPQPSREHSHLTRQAATTSGKAASAASSSGLSSAGSLCDDTPVQAPATPDGPTGAFDDDANVPSKAVPGDVQETGPSSFLIGWTPDQLDGLLTADWLAEARTPAGAGASSGATSSAFAGVSDNSALGASAGPAAVPADPLPSVDELMQASSANAESAPASVSAACCQLDQSSRAHSPREPASTAARPTLPSSPMTDSGSSLGLGTRSSVSASTSVSTTPAQIASLELLEAIRQLTQEVRQLKQVQPTQPARRRTATSGYTTPGKARYGPIGRRRSTFPHHSDWPSHSTAQSKRQTSVQSSGAVDAAIPAADSMVQWSDAQPHSAGMEATKLANEMDAAFEQVHDATDETVKRLGVQHMAPATVAPALPPVAQHGEASHPEAKSSQETGEPPSGQGLPSLPFATCSATTQQLDTDQGPLSGTQRLELARLLLLSLQPSTLTGSQSRPI